ncbi:MAG: BON domain-containing protein, partial [Proteobacteria bacterium]
MNLKTTVNASLVATLLLFAGLLPSPAFAASVDSVETTSPSYTDTHAHLPTAESDQRSESILSKLLKEAGSFPQVKVQVREGVVLIDGMVDQEKQLEFLEKAANRLPTVISVVNRVKAKNRDILDISPAVSET